MSLIAVAGEMETVRGKPPKSASAKFPGVCTVNVGVPLWLLCLEMNIISFVSGKFSGRFWAFIDSSFSLIRVTGFWLMFVV